MILRTPATCLLALAPLAALADEGVRSRRESIDQPGDVLPAAVVATLDPGLKHRVLGGADVPVYLLVNPDLGGAAADERELRALMHPPGSEPFEAPDVLAALAERTWDEKPLLYSLLKDVSGEFLRQIFGDDVQKADSLEKLIAKGALLSNRLILCTVDATCEGVPGPAEGITVELWFRVWRVDFDESKYPYPVRAMELLFSDRAAGTALVHETDAERRGDELRATFRAAVVDAYRDRIALSLWGSARMTDHGWLGEPRADLVGPPLGQLPGRPPSTATGATTGNAAGAGETEVSR